MSAIAILSKEKYLRAKKVAGDDQVKLVEEYKKLTPAWVEGSNEEIERTPKYIGFFDEEKKAKKPAKKMGGKKKKK